jgi:HAE1 family hydrophobic/amphiphilic exporter-1
MKENSALVRTLLHFRIGGLVLAFATISAPGISAQQADSAVQESAKPKSSTADLPPLTPSPIEKAEKDGTALRMSLKDLTKLALQNNLDIAIQDTNEQLSQQKIIQQYGAYDPTLTASLGVNSTKSANTNLATASIDGSFNKMDRANWNLQFQQAVKTGGTLQASWNSSRSDNNQSFSLFTPQYNGSATVTFTQPLRRNLRIDQTRAQIKIVNLDLQTSDSKFKQKVVETIANIQSQYWDLVSAIRDYDIKRNSVQLAQISLRDNRKKVEVGTLAPINITEAEATLAQREVDLISSEERILSQENTLRALVSNNRNSEIWTQVIVPTESPDFKEYKVDLQNAITTALANRPELEQSDIALKQSDINEGLLRNNRKWQFDLTAAFGSTGVSGPQSYRNGVPQTPEALIGGLGNAYKTIFTEGFTNWQVGFQVQIPLRNRSLDSQLAQQQITKRQTLMQKKNTEQSIQVDVRNAVQRLETNKRQVETTGVGRRAAQAQLEGEVKRFDAGLSENYLVLQRQSDLSQAEYNELQALINYKKAIINLQKVMYTLLESNDFDIAKGSSSNVPDLK